MLITSKKWLHWHQWYHLNHHTNFAHQFHVRSELQNFDKVWRSWDQRFIETMKQEVNWLSDQVIDLIKRMKIHEMAPLGHHFISEKPPGQYKWLWFDWFELRQSWVIHATDHGWFYFILHFVGESCLKSRVISAGPQLAANFSEFTHESPFLKFVSVLTMIGTNHFAYH